MGCQTKIAEQIIEQGGDYVLALKGNQETLAAEVEEAFITADARDYADMETDFLRDRRARPRARGDASLPHLDRSVRCLAPPAVEGDEHDRHGRVHPRDQRQVLDGDPLLHRQHRPRCADLRHRGTPHWGIENKLHWGLDVPSARTTAACARPAPARTSRCCATSP
jgi:predicted transposase YbfD/YdcC